MRKARIVAGAGPAGLTHVLTRVLQPNPLTFLQHNKLFVAGSTRRVTVGEQNVQNFSFLYNPAHDRYEFRPNAFPGGIPVPVESVVAVHWTQVPERDVDPARGSFARIRGVELSGNHVMVTTQFTGCSFCMKQAGARVFCAHIAPHVEGVPHSMAPNELARQLCGQRAPAAIGGDFANAAEPGEFRVYGAGAGNGRFPNGYTLGVAGGGANDYMTMVGFPGAAGYQIFSQITRNRQIAGVVQVF